MFAAKHKLSNLILIVDDNKISMLDYQRDIMGLSPLRPKFETFNWEVQEVDGHDFAALGRALEKASNGPGEKPRLILAETVKGKGVPSLEGDILCHVRSLSANDVDELLRGESYRVQ
jgi:transketolase